MSRIIVFCRPGFESEAGRELTDAAALLGVFGYFKAQAGSGCVEFSLSGSETPAELMKMLPLNRLVFVRDWFELIVEVPLPKSDRVGAVIDALRESVAGPKHCDRVEIRVSEDNPDHDLGNFARKWIAPLAKALRGAGLMEDATTGQDQDRLEIFLPDFSTAMIGMSHRNNRSPFPGGIPRLRLPAAAPSRSALKLEEAWKVFLSPDRKLEVLGGGKKAVDLGAAPGGWTWQLVRQGMLVTAVDNGPMDSDLMASGHVEHVTADGFRWRPRRGVDWMVCDIVDQPRKTAALASDWLANKLCRYTVFNLKLPMKKRYEEWLFCQQLMADRLDEAGVQYRLQARHLYHDREEITCFIERLIS
ncbi:23S rRNA (cytidine(2498)-2'-O)-methyltransferase RlmM [Marinobacter caseinilyticus]|uniref:23S rRNA (cytidine(2498)-2'-O)-methyltransferase RlmM n=1 Tax=Marinobacter caseinilyticus TaxID=2692195 RepID=UPI00140C65A1|nr:23S rRNA (cytidine(2498)-2'-O)-methyltransferase RlmM [Marinobacter caseinilyticus]